MGLFGEEERARKKGRLSAGGGELNTFLGEGTSFKGILNFEGTVRIDGQLEGEVFTTDTLVVGETAAIRATIHAGVLVVSGTIHGNVSAERKVELVSGARLFGNISTPLLSIAEGVVFEGGCTMGRGAGREKGRPLSPPCGGEPKRKDILTG